MPMEPNAVIWGALLGGCRTHKNSDIARIALDNLTILEPNSTGNYALLLGMYAEANTWREVSRIRADLKASGVEKEFPGSSWIEVEKTVHQFSACINCHPASQEIYSLPDELRPTPTSTIYHTKMVYFPKNCSNNHSIFNTITPKWGRGGEFTPNMAHTKCSTIFCFNFFLFQK
ncbi:unnamed protein product [Cuscuta europaea]|uniref:DYW domain-containing protein n=1 Tax=Cuscuta europaea TaxID=41803 RepID=A0A9P0Z8M5_CUSEU|nr:unnamed protein product [Cuscuta europaea]